MTPVIYISNRPIGQDYAPFIIAEAGINHNGELGKALQMIGVAKEAGADAIKFQTFKADEFVGSPEQTYTYKSQGREVTEPMRDMFHRYELPRQAWFEIKSECQRQNIIFLSTPQNRGDLDLLREVGIPSIKVGSDDFTNLPLLRDYAETKLPLILSCGMADLSEIYRSLETVGALDGYPTALLLCTSQYPTPATDVNLRKLCTLRASFPTIVLGYSDHTQGPLASSLAVALGASVFEKHFTLSHDLPGPDHWFSEDGPGLKEWVLSIKRSAEMMGSPVVRPTESERINKSEFSRVIVAARHIESGEKYSPENLVMRRIGGGKGLPASLFDFVVGKTAKKAYLPGTAIEL